jgi:tetratricopeptide (TPR) repeat protein
MLIILDNAESILDPEGPDARGIYSVVEELSRFKMICLCITSRITTVPRECKRLVVPTLSMEAACDIFYGIYGDGERSRVISNLIQRLDFHALSISLLATTASRNMWDYNRLAQEWDARRTQVLRTDHNESLAATIELSITSSMFRKLGPRARDLLSVVAFFPQGVNENNHDWLFPTVPGRRKIFDKFCALSLTYRRDGFITMLAPLRDYLRPEDPTLSPLLWATKDRYLRRLSVYVHPDLLGYERARWIISEDVNIEYLLDVFTSIDRNSDSIWDACAHFMDHLFWHRKRLVVLGPKLEGLPDDHPSKPECLHHLSLLFTSVGDDVECKRLLVHTLKLWRAWGNNHKIADTLYSLAYTNKYLGLYKEGILQAKESLEIFRRFNRMSDQARCLQRLAWLLCADNQLGAAEEAASRAIHLYPDSNQYGVFKGHYLLGDICRSKDEAEKAINHYEAALRIADSFHWHNQQHSVHFSLAQLFSHQGRFDDAHTHVEHAKSYAFNDPYHLGQAMELHARIWYGQCRLEEAKPEALCAVGVFEGLGAVKDLERCRKLLQDIEKGMENLITSDEADF